MLAKESFYRKLSALDALRHPHIVEMIGFGFDSKRLPYIALEWVDTNLDSVIKGLRRPLQWKEFWSQYGRPVLDAICAAQSSRFLHRDIKPKNILVTSSGVAKVSDYGISRLGDRDQNPAPGRPTFRHHGSKPYTPPEPDDGNASYTRDGFSWGVVAVYCLTGEEPTDYGVIPELIDRVADAPTEILRRACSISPGDRPKFASLLLEEIDEWEAARASGVHGRLECYIALDQSALGYVADVLGPEERDPAGALLADLRETSGIRTVQNDPNRLRVIGASWQLYVYRSPLGQGVLVGERAGLLGPAEAERQRDRAWCGPLEIAFAEPGDSKRASAALDELFAEVCAAEEERLAKHQTDPDRIFRGWQAYLQARLNFETGRGRALPYSDRQIHGKQVMLTVTDPVSPDVIGPEQMIRVGQRYIMLTVLGILGDQITLEVTFGNASDVPRKGFLVVNTVRAERAIDRQWQALNAVLFRRSVNASLRDIIVSPQTARAPLPIRIDNPGDDFDADKREVLAKALGVQDLLAVEGPPGTGKTRLIEEVIVQYLGRNERHRVLLSSQTHVALDNVIERVRKRNPALDIVRVGRFDDPKIAAIAADLLLERKCDAWAERVGSKARAWLTAWAAENGVDPSDVQAGMITL
jgi:hypothetical protein